jgi:hypothetical protein
VDTEKDQGIETIPTGSAKQAGDLGRPLRALADRHFADHEGLARAVWGLVHAWFAVKRTRAWEFVSAD